MQFNKLTTLFIILWMLFPKFVFAIDCSNPTTQIEINQCTASELDAETAAINAVYNRYRTNLNTVDKDQIKNVQLAWIKYRDLACKFEASPVEGGSMHSYVLSQCLIRQSKARRQQLESLLRCDTGVSPGSNCNR